MAAGRSGSDRWLFWIGVGTLVIMAGWSVAAATYLAFRDDVLRTLIAHQAEQQFAYEDRIAELRAQIDRTTSRQLLDQEQFEQKLDDLMRRQAMLEQRATSLGGRVRSGHHRLDRPAPPATAAARAIANPASATVSARSKPRSIASSSAKGWL